MNKRGSISNGSDSSSSNCNGNLYLQKKQI